MTAPRPREQADPPSPPDRRPPRRGGRFSPCTYAVSAAGRPAGLARQRIARRSLIGSARALAATALLALSGALALPAQAQTTCTPNPGDIWCGVVTVGVYSLEFETELGETDIGYGFEDIDDAAGALSDKTFSVRTNGGTNSYWIDTAYVGTGSNAGVLNFGLIRALTAADRAKLVLHVGSAKFAFSDATGPTRNQTYQWPNSGLDWSSTTNVTLRLGEVPVAPGNFRATAGDAQVTLAWDAPASDSGVTRHEYRFKTDGDYPESWEEIPNSAPDEANENAFTVTGLTNEVAHTFEHRAVNASGDGDAAEVGPVTPTSGICDRTQKVHEAIVRALSGVGNCAAVNAADLAGLMALYMGSQNITSLKSGDFAGLTSMITLSLGNNSLITLPADVFSGLTALRFLNLDNNALSSPPGTVFSGLTSLTTLNLYGNALNVLPDGLFSGLTSLTTLNLSENALSLLPAGVFFDLTALTYLDLRNNDLSSLPGTVFSGLTSLIDLRLNGNALNALPDGLFSGLTALTTLNLNENALNLLPAGVFSGLSTLTTLNLDNNALSSLPGTVFSDLTSLTALRLNGNALNALPDGLFSGLTALTTLALGGNPTNPLELTVTVEKVGTDRARAKVLAGAPFSVDIPVTVANGALEGGATALSVAAGSVDGAPVTVTRPAETTAAVTVDVDLTIQPTLPSNHRGYTFVKPTLGAPATIPAPTACTLNTGDLWCGVVTVGRLPSSDFNLNGYFRTRNIGALSDQTFTVGRNNYRIDTINVASSVRRRSVGGREGGGFIDPPDLTGFFTFGLNRNLSAADKARLVLHVDGSSKPFAFRVPSHIQYHLYIWDDTGLDWSSESFVTLRLRLEVLGKPTGLTATASGDAQIDLSWTAPRFVGGSAITGYRVEVSEDGSTGWSDLVADTGNTDTSYTHSGLAPGSTRHYRVSAINAVGTSEPSEVVSDTTATTCTPNPDDIWCGVVTVGAYNFGRLIFYGFDSSVGNLSDTGFRVGTNSYTIDSVLGRTGLNFSLTRSLTAADRAKLVLYVGSASFAFSDSPDPTPIHTYQWRNSGLDWSSEDYVTLRLRLEAPGQPTNLVAEANGSRQIDLTWEAPADDGGSAITGYGVEVSEDGNTGWSDLEHDTGTADTSYSHTGLSPGSTRHYRVSAINAGGRSEASAAAAATLDTTAPDAPTGFRAIADGGTQIDLSWSAPADDGGSAITGYRVEVSDNRSTDWSDLVADTSNTDTSYTHSGLAPGSTRHYRVSAINAVGTSEPSQIVPGTTNCTPNHGDIWCGVVTVGEFDFFGVISYGFKPSVGNLSDTGFRVGTNSYTIDGVWTETGTLTFSLTSALSAADRAKLVLHVGSAEFAFSAANYRSASHTYRWTGTGLDWLSTTNVTLRLRRLLGTPDQPTNLVAEANGSTQIDLTWEAPADGGESAITGYRIEVSDNGSTGWSDLEDDTGNTDTSYTHSGLAAGSTRHYRVSAINAVGTSEPSEIVSDTTPCTLNPGDIWCGVVTVERTTNSAGTIFYAGSVSPSGFTVPPNSYTIDRVVLLIGSTLTVDLTSVLTATDREKLVLHVGIHSFAFSAAAILPFSSFYVWDDNDLDWSSTTNVTLRLRRSPEAPGQPTNLVAKADRSTQIDLTWEAPTDDGGSAITGYRIEVSDNGNTGWSDLEDDTGNTDTSYTHSGLAAGDTRHYRVSAINAVGTSESSEVVYDTTPPACTLNTGDLWCGVVTVGRLPSSDFNLNGYFRTRNIGALSDQTFTVGRNNYRIDTIDVASSVRGREGGES